MRGLWVGTADGGVAQHGVDTAAADVEASISAAECDGVDGGSGGARGCYGAWLARACAWACARLAHTALERTPSRRSGCAVMGVRPALQGCSSCVVHQVGCALP